MRPRMPVLFWAEDPDQGAPLAFSMFHGIDTVKVWPALSDYYFLEALKTIHRFRLVVVMAADPVSPLAKQLASEACRACHGCGIPVLAIAGDIQKATTMEASSHHALQPDNSELFELIRFLIRRKRGVRKGLGLRRNTAIAQGVAASYDGQSPSALA